MLIGKTESATNARKAFFKLLDEIAQNSSVVIVKRKDAPNVAMIAESELSGLLETIHLLRSPKNADRLFSALAKSRDRDLDTPDAETSRAADHEQVLEDLRQYCEQTEEANTIEVTAAADSQQIPNLRD